MLRAREMQIPRTDIVATPIDAWSWLAAIREVIGPPRESSGPPAVVSKPCGPVPVGTSKRGWSCNSRGRSTRIVAGAATVSVLHDASANRRTDAGLPPRAVLDAAMKIVGSLQADGDLQVDAKIDGDVRCRQLTIGKCGMISGDITAEEVVIRGTVKGAIRASRVIIQHGAHVQSDISPDKLSIEEGSYFKGTIIQKDREEPDASPETVIPSKVG